MARLLSVCPLSSYVSSRHLFIDQPPARKGLFIELFKKLFLTFLTPVTISRYIFKLRALCDGNFMLFSFLFASESCKPVLRSSIISSWYFTDYLLSGRRLQFQGQRIASPPSFISNVKRRGSYFDIFQLSRYYI